MMEKSRSVQSSVVVCLLMVRLLCAAEDASWPQWRGPQRDGSVSGGPWPESLQETHLVRQWRQELPPSYSGPVVVQDKVFVTFTRDKRYEGVRALDRQSGEKLWEAEWEGVMEVAKLGTSMGSWIRATPTRPPRRTSEASATNSRSAPGRK